MAWVGIVGDCGGTPTSATAQQFGYILGISGKQIAQTFSQGATSAIDRFAQAVANGKNVFGSLRDAFLRFAADFLRQIAQMIEQQIIFNMVASVLSSVGFGGGPATAGGGSSGFPIRKLHDGGIAGQDGRLALARPEWFSNMLRFHDGGIPGLRQNEIPAILERGEEVLTRDDPRHVANGGGGAAPNIKIVNTIDARDAVSQGLNTKVGEKALLNVIRMNSRAVKVALS